MTEKRKVAVVGATGMLGAPVTNRLADLGIDVTAVVRNTDKAKRKLKSEVQLLKGDLKDVESLCQAFKSADVVYLSLHTGPFDKGEKFRAEIEGVKNAIEAARQTGIRRIGYLSSLVKDYQEMDWWVFDIKRQACRILLDSDIPVTMFYPSNFFENLPALQMVGNRVMVVGRQKTKSWWVSTKDYARQVAAALHQEHDDNREYPVQGLEPMNFDEAAKVFIEHYPHKKLRKTNLPIGFLKVLKPFSAQIDYQYSIVHAINNYDEEFKSEKTWRELGKPNQRLAEFARML